MKIAISLILTFLSFAASAADAPQEAKLALNWKAEPQFGGFYAAQKILEKQKFKLNLQEGGSGTPTVQMLAAGQTDYAILSADELLIARDRGAQDLIAIFATYQTNPQGIMTHAERNFQKIEDVFKSEGTLLWQSGLPYAQFIQHRNSDFKVKTAPYLGGIGNFQKDPQISQQCFVTSEPLTAEKAGLKVKTFLVADTGYNPYTTVLAIKSSLLKEKPEQVKKVVQAVREGWAEYLKNPKPTNEAMAALNKAMDLETFQKSAEAQKPLIEVKSTPLGSMTLERWQTLALQLFELKLIKNKLKPKDLFQNL